MHGLARSLVRNVVEGVATGFSKALEINVVGYRVQAKKDDLIFSLGYSHGYTVQGNYKARHITQQVYSQSEMG